MPKLLAPNLPVDLYTRNAVVAMDAAAIASGIPGYTLMRRAGAAVFAALQQRFDACSRLLVLCGAGNNAGDGYVIARLAWQAGWPVRVASLTEVEGLQGDAATACEHWLELGQVLDFETSLLHDCDVIVDALLGTGLAREVEGAWRQAIESVNASGKPVVAVDIPSGLDADSGVIHGAAIEADLTVSFIALKQGMFTASGRQCCGQVQFDDLGVPVSIIGLQSPSACLLDARVLQQLPRRRQDSHKGNFGHLLVVGGNHGMTGAVALAAKAALRSGAGRVSVVSRPEHVAIVTSVCPEAMVYASDNGQIDAALLAACTHVLIGPGLGFDAWAQRLLYQIVRTPQPALYDADALNLLAQAKKPSQEECFPDNAVVITPHPGEAARLLQTGTASIQQQRFDAVTRCQLQSRAVAVLKGSGTLVHDGERIHVCDGGSAAMASAGMGDVLAGVIAALLAQGLPPSLAACIGVYAHAWAAEQAAQGADRGLLASDVIVYLVEVWR